MMLRMNWIFNGQETIDLHQSLSSSFILGLEVGLWNIFSMTCIVSD